MIVINNPEGTANFVFGDVLGGLVRFFKAAINAVINLFNA